MVPGLLEALTADEGDLVELPDFHELPEDLSSEDLLVQVVPEMADEFTCSACFLVQHRSRRSRTDPTICIDCQ
jgi:hypothetical protein